MMTVSSKPPFEDLPSVTPEDEERALASRASDPSVGEHPGDSEELTEELMEMGRARMERRDRP